MPELPEVETTVRRIAAEVTGKRIRAFDAFWPRQLSHPVAQLRTLLEGRTIAELGRRGKHILFHLQPAGVLVVHLGMSGSLCCAGARQRPPTHLRAIWTLSGGSRLWFVDPRKFGRVRYADDAAAATLGLGPEPLEAGFTPRAFGALLRERGRQLKPLLLDQSVVAGLGNIYADEALFRARLHPLTCAGSLSIAQIRRLHQAIREVLSEAIAHAGTSFDWAYEGGNMQTRLNVYHQTGEPCARCSTPVAMIRLGGRSTHFCPRCQPRPVDAPDALA